MTDTASRLLVLDTNFLLHLVRGNEFGQGLDEAYGLRTRTERPLLSRVVVAEMFSLTEQFGWGAMKKALLAELLRELVAVEIHAQVIVETWARFHTYLKTNGFTVGDNDVWIAATTAAVGGILLTTDKDFTPLIDKGWLEWIYVQPPGSPSPSSSQ